MFDKAEVDYEYEDLPPPSAIAQPQYLFSTTVQPIEPDEIKLRKHFPETWMWEDFDKEW